jgi:hypothetical protein
MTVALAACWIAAGCPTNSWALTQGMGVGLDGSQSIASTPNFWLPGSVFFFFEMRFSFSTNDG